MAPTATTLTEETAEVQVLLASLSKTQDLTKRIGASLARMQFSSDYIKDAIAPVAHNTRQLQATGYNIDKINQCIEKLRQPLDSKNKEESIIRAGPQASGLQQYLSALRRIDRALSELSSSNLRSNQQAITDYQSLLSTGVAQLLELYRSALVEDEFPIEPVHYLTKQLKFPTFSQEKAQHLSEIANAIVSASAQAARLGQRDDDQGVSIYADIRGDYLANSLQNLATASINTAKKSPSDTTPYRPLTNAIGPYIDAISHMFSAEFDNISRIFRGEVIARVYAASTTKSLVTFANTLAELSAIVRSRIMSDCFLAFEIVDLATPLASTDRIDRGTGFIRSQISDALRPIIDTARTSLTEIPLRTRAQINETQSLPPDGSTTPLIQAVANILVQLAQYERPLAPLLASSAPDQDPTSGLRAYVTNYLEAVLSTLSSRSATLLRRPAQSIFLLNTIAVLTRTLTNTPTLSSPSTSTLLESHRKQAVSAYMTLWREPSAHLLDTITTTSSSSSRPLSGPTNTALDSAAILKSLSSKDKDRIKDKFRLFNASFDDLVTKHKAMTPGMEREVRVALQRDVTATIEPLYARFYDRYGELEKGKGKGKTVKYTKAELAAILAGL